MGCSSESAEPSPEPAGGASPSTPTDSSVFPAELTLTALEAFLDQKTYQSSPWVADPAPRPSQDPGNPHNHVRVYFNPRAVQSIQEGRGDRSAHLAESMVVKEMYNAEEELLGLAVSLKTEDSREASSWLYYCRGSGFFCGSSDASETKPLFSAGHQDCFSCHMENFYAPLPR